MVYTSNNHIFDIIVLVPSIIFQTYDMSSYDASCDHSHVLLHYPKRNLK